MKSIVLLQCMCGWWSRIGRGMGALLVAGLLGSGVGAQAATLEWTGSEPGAVWSVGGDLNWLTGGLPGVFANGDDVYFGDQAVSFAPVITGVVQPNSITVGGTKDYQFSGAGQIDGATGLRKEGPNTLVIANANSFTGPVVVDNGILKYGALGALGTAAGYVYATNQGSVDLNKTDTSLRTNIIAGAGYEGRGAIINTSTDSGVNNLVNAVEMLDDATVSSVGRWNIKIGGTFIGNGHNLTKIGPGAVWLHRCGPTGLGDIEVKEGILGAYPPIDLGDPSKTLTVYPGARFDMWRTTDNVPPFNLDKKLVLNGATINSGFTPANAGSNVWVGPVNLSLTNTLNISSGDLHLSNSVSGSGGFIKIGARTLFLHAANTYAGPTIISAGKVVLGAEGTLGSGDLVEFRGAGTLDMSASGEELTLGSGGALIGVQGATVVGNVNLQNGATFDVGKGRPGVVTVDGDLSLSGVTVQTVLGPDPTDLTGSVNGLIRITGTLAAAGVNTFVIETVGSLDNTTPYTVAQFDMNFSGSLENFKAVSANPNYTFTFLDPYMTWPYLQVTAAGSALNLLWHGGDAEHPNNWDLSTVNWINKADSQPSRFYDSSPAFFDDTAVTKEITVAEDISAVMTFQHASGDYVLTGPGTLKGALKQEGDGTITVATAKMPELTSIANDAGTLVLALPGGNATISAPITGQGQIIKSSANTVTLTGDNSMYQGTLVITNGVLRYNNLKALGTVLTPLYATNGGSLDLNHVDPGLKPIAVSGAGYQGQGAISHSSTDTSMFSAVGNLEFLGDTTLGSMGRWNTKIGATVRGNGYNLTKVGTGQVWFYNCDETDLGDIEVVAGTLGVHSGVRITGLGDPSKTLTLQPGSTFTLWQVPTLDKQLIMNRATVSSGFTGDGSNTFLGPITLNLTNTFSLGSADLHLSNSISGSGGLTKTGVKTLYLHGPNTYTGPTTINNNSGAIVVGAESSLASEVIQIGTGSVLDVSRLTALALGNGQFLGGNNGKVLGNVILGAGATLVPGMNTTRAWTLQIEGNLTLQTGATNLVVVNKTSSIANNKVTGLSAVQLGGTLTVVNVGDPLAAGDALPLFAANTYSGEFEEIIPATPGPGLAWDTETLLTDGTLRVISGGVDPTPPSLTWVVTDNEIQLTWPPTHLGWTLQAQTNAPGVGLTADWVDVPGSAAQTQINLPVDPNHGSVFYRLILQP